MMASWRTDHMEAIMTDKIETEYDRAWRERGEAEHALRLWQRNQSSPTFTKVMGVIGGVLGGLMICAANKDWNWGFSPIIVILGMLFSMLPFIGPSIIRDEERNRAKAEATLKRLGVWK
jgi:hypothetical protein